MSNIISFEFFDSLFHYQSSMVDAVYLLEDSDDSLHYLKETYLVFEGELG